MFVFELALALGYPHPNHLLAEISSEQLTDWEAFFRLRPFGFARDSYLFGSLLAQQHNMNKTKGRDRTWRDFCPINLHEEIVQKDGEGRDSPDKFFAAVKEYNLERGFPANGR